MSTLARKAGSQPAGGLTRFLLPAMFALVAAAPTWCRAQEDKKNDKPQADAGQEAPAGQEQPLAKPPEIPEVTLVPVLHTVPVPRDRRTFNVQMVNTALLPRDKDGIWVLDFAFKPLRIKTVDIPGKGRRQVHYLYYKVANRTGKPRVFVPQFIMVNEDGKRFDRQRHPRGHSADPSPRRRHDSASGGRQYHGRHPAQHETRR